MMQHIETNPRFKKITWEMTNYCNYKCSYCNEECNGGSVPLPKDYNHIIELVENFRNNEPLIFDIMGGEPTLWPKFKDFCNALKDTSTSDTHIVFSTNASRTMRWWKTFDASVSDLGLSFHPEQASVDHFLDVIKEVQLKYNTTVYIMCPPTGYEKSIELFNKIKENQFVVRAMLKPAMDWGSGGKGYVKGYSEKLLKTISKSNYKHKDCKRSTISQTLYYNGKESNVRKLINDQLNQFKGWSCKLGQDYLYIKADGSIQGAACGIKGSLLGNLDTGYELKTEPVICTRNFCGCAADIEVEKWFTNTPE